MEEVEKETNKFVKMVRIVRNISEDQETLPTPLNKIDAHENLRN